MITNKKIHVISLFTVLAAVLCLGQNDCFATQGIQNQSMVGGFKDKSTFNSALTKLRGESGKYQKGFNKYLDGMNKVLAEREAGPKTQFSLPLADEQKKKLKEFLKNIKNFANSKLMETTRQEFENIKNRKDFALNYKLATGKIYKSKGYQIHHIIPIEFGGSNDYFNMIQLSKEEHTEVHTLLTEITKNN